MIIKYVLNTATIYKNHIVYHFYKLLGPAFYDAFFFNSPVLIVV
jgi:hypothetical protein